MIKAKKDLGQNFLIDEIIINKIVETINPDSEDIFLEIGPGKGAITRPLLRFIKHLHAVEIDDDLIKGLEKIEKTNISLHNESILNFQPDQYIDKNLRVMGNLPYNISTQIMLWTFKNLTILKDIHFMFQKEFGERLLSANNKKSFGRLSVLTQYLTKPEFCFEIEPESFFPEPKVESIFIKFLPIEGRDFEDSLTQKLQEVSRIAFMHKRKMIGKSLKSLLSVEELTNLGIDMKARPENLSVEDYVKISETLI